MATPELPDTTRALYPFESQFFTLSDGTRLHYIDEGPQDSGEVLLFVHGYPMWSFEFRALVVYYAAQGVRCVALDHVGYGLSDKPTDKRYHTLKRHTDNLIEFIDGLALHDVTLALEDWGGPLGLGYALARAGNVKRLALMNTWAFQDTYTNRMHPLINLLTQPVIGELVFGTFNLVFTLGVQRWTARDLSWSVLMAYKTPFREVRSRTALVQFPRMINARPTHPSAEAMRAIESNLDHLRHIPTLLLWGDKDPLFPPDVAEHWHTMLPRAKGPVFIEDAGHFLPEDAPNEVVRHLDAFLDST